MNIEDFIMVYPETAPIYEDAWLNYTKTHKKPRRKADLEMYMSEAASVAEKAVNEAIARKTIKRVVEILEGSKHYEQGYDWGNRDGAPIEVFELDPLVWQELEKLVGD